MSPSQGMRYRDWLRQAENDLQWAEHSLEGGFYAQTCFVAQQAAEKALKALSFFRGYDEIRTHSLYLIIRAFEGAEEVGKDAQFLDLYYISSRYPDAFPAGAPFELITQEQAHQALEAARRIYGWVVGRIEETGQMG